MTYYCGACGIIRPNGCACRAEDTTDPPADMTANNRLLAVNLTAVYDAVGTPGTTDSPATKRNTMRPDLKKKRKKKRKLKANAHDDLPGYRPATTTQPEETTMNDNDLDDLDNLPGYRPAQQTDDDELEPIRVEPIDYAELSVFGGDELATNTTGGSDADGLVTNERGDGGIPTTDIDWEQLSCFRPRR